MNRIRISLRRLLCNSALQLRCFGQVADMRCRIKDGICPLQVGIRINDLQGYGQRTAASFSQVLLSVSTFGEAHDNAWPLPLQKDQLGIFR